ncbi:restriction endonuclease [Streptomyces sp. NPDC060031]|uniref:restriction endonuclease n=1 Tax=Streptomyces sp. NPDC060031 TaxID=3347043 RepID=UPI00368C8817
MHRGEAVLAYEATRADDKVASKGIVVTTAWFGKASHDFAPLHRLELIDGRHLKALLLEHLGIDALIGLPQLPLGWETRNLTWQTGTSTARKPASGSGTRRPAATDSTPSSSPHSPNWGRSGPSGHP